MIMRSLITALVSLACGFIIVLLEEWIKSHYISKFLNENMLVLLIALLAINSTTMGIVLTKIREIADERDAHSKFTIPKKEMLHSIHEQIGLVIVGAIFLSISESAALSSITNLLLLINSLICGVFVYSLILLYDTSKSVFIISEFESNSQPIERDDT